MARRAAPGSELAVSIVTVPPLENDIERAARVAHDARLAEAGEPVLTVPQRDVALRWLREAGWTITSVEDSAGGQRPEPSGRLLVLAGPG